MSRQAQIRVSRTLICVRHSAPEFTFSDLFYKAKAAANARPSAATPNSARPLAPDLVVDAAVLDAEAEEEDAAAVLLVLVAEEVLEPLDAALATVEERLDVPEDAPVALLPDAEPVFVAAAEPVALPLLDAELSETVADAAVPEVVTCSARHCELKVFMASVVEHKSTSQPMVFETRT
jgi:hypothetical protein